MNLLQFPLRVEHEDRPDLVLTMPPGQTGIEIIEAVHCDKAKVDAYSGHTNESTTGDSSPAIG